MLSPLLKATIYLLVIIVQWLVKLARRHGERFGHHAFSQRPVRGDSLKGLHLSPVSEFPKAPTTGQCVRPSLPALSDNAMQVIHIFDAVAPIVKVKENRVYLASLSIGELSELTTYTPPPQTIFNAAYGRRWRDIVRRSNHNDNDLSAVFEPSYNGHRIMWRLFEAVITCFGGRIALGIDPNEEDWATIAAAMGRPAHVDAQFRADLMQHYKVLEPTVKEWIFEAARVIARRNIGGRLKSLSPVTPTLSELDQSLQHLALELHIGNAFNTELERSLGNAVARVNLSIGDYITRIATDSRIRIVFRELPDNHARLAIRMVRETLSSSDLTSPYARRMVLKLLQDIVNYCGEMPTEWQIPWSCIVPDHSRPPISAGEAVIRFASCDLRGVRKYVAIRTLKEAPEEDALGIKAWNIKQTYTRAIVAHASMDHPFLVPFEGYTIIEGSTDLSVVMKAMKTTLRDYPLSKRVRRDQIFFQVASALGYLHSHEIVHGDIHWRNVLVDNEGVAYLSDFGISRLVHVDNSTTTAPLSSSIPMFVAPEVRLDPQRRPDTSGDVYACGILFLAVAMTRCPQAPNSVETLLRSYSNLMIGPLQASVPTDLPIPPRMPTLGAEQMDIWGLMQKMASYDPATRPLIGDDRTTSKHADALQTMSMLSTTSMQFETPVSGTSTVLGRLEEVFPEGRACLSQVLQDTTHTKLWEDVRTA